MIASVGAVCDLDLVVIGGGVAKSGKLLFDPLREALTTYARLDFLRGLRVLPAELGGDAGLVGAAALLTPEKACAPCAFGPIARLDSTEHRHALMEAVFRTGTMPRATAKCR